MIELNRETFQEFINSEGNYSSIFMELQLRLVASHLLHLSGDAAARSEFSASPVIPNIIGINPRSVFQLFWDFSFRQYEV
jgi:hypothetical protein